jgi:hypothetical protein
MHSRFILNSFSIILNSDINPVTNSPVGLVWRYNIPTRMKSRTKVWNGNKSTYLTHLMIIQYYKIHLFTTPCVCSRNIQLQFFKLHGYWLHQYWKTGLITDNLGGGRIVRELSLYYIKRSLVFACFDMFGCAHWLLKVLSNDARWHNVRFHKSCHQKAAFRSTSNMGDEDVEIT